jgi:hypothetical protein
MAVDDFLEIRRRSLVMLSPGAPAGLSREEALELMSEVQRLRRELAVAHDERVAALRRHPAGAGG